LNRGVDVISKDEIAKLKGEGILAQKQEGYFSIRILSRAGNFTSEELCNLARLSQQYGRGYLGVTTRMTVEIPWIKYEDIESLKNDLKEVKLYHVVYYKVLEYHIYHVGILFLYMQPMV